MNYIVLDLEWNQPQPGKERNAKDLLFEIVEIGAVKLDANRHPIGEFHRYIAPKVYKELNYITAGILKIKMKDLKREGIPFAEAAEDFLAWCRDGGEYRFCTWGSMDLTELQKNCRYYAVETDFEHPFVYDDLQKMYSLCYDDGKSRLSLEDATAEMGMETDLQFHSAMNDARYTARIMEKMDYDKVSAFTSVDIYVLPRDRKEEFTMVYPTYSKYVSHTYATWNELSKDTYLLSSICPLCGENAKKKIRWFVANQKNYYCVAHCKEHGAIKGRMKVRRTEDGRYYVIKIMKPTDEEGVAAIREKQAAGRERRRERRHREKERNARLKQESVTE